MQDSKPIIGNNLFLVIDKTLSNKKAPFKAEKGAKNYHPLKSMVVELVGFEPTSKHIPGKLSTCLFQH